MSRPGAYTGWSSHRKVLRNLDDNPSQPIYSDESFDEAEELDASIEGQSVLGLSISKRQSRLASPTTSVAERTAALQAGGQFGLDGVTEGVAPSGAQETGLDAKRPDHPTLTFAENRPQPSSSLTSPHALPSPWKSGPKYFQGIETATSSLMHNMGSMLSLSSLSPFRRASDAADKGNRENSGRGSFHLPLSSRSRRRSGNESDQSTGQNDRVKELKRQSYMRRASVGPLSPPADGGVREAPPMGRPLMRRSTSDGFLLERALSDTPSLGDNTSWEHVSEMFNARKRAIKDSFLDSNIKIPGVKSFTSFTMPSPFSDFFASNPTASTQDGTTATSTTDVNIKDKEPVLAPSFLNKTSPVTHPQFAQALENLTGDIVIMGGYRGSVLRSAKPPHRQQWIPIKVGLNLRKVDLELGLDTEDEENSEDLIIPSGMLKNIGPIDISKRLLKRLRACKNAQEGRLRVWDHGYDWRLSPHLLTRKLVAFLKDLPCNAPGVPEHERGATVLAHSLGGLITRHAVNTNPALFGSVIYAGVPQHCVNILGPIRNGDDVLLSSRVLTAQTNFTIRTTFALLPLDGKCFYDRDTKEQYPVDFFDVKTWEDYRFSPVIARPFPPLSSVASTNSSTSLLGSLVDLAASAMGGRRLSSTTLSSQNRKASGSTTDTTTTNSTTSTGKSAATFSLDGSGPGQSMAPQMNQNQHDTSSDHDPTSDNISTHVTIPHDRAVAYLTRVLAETKKFKEELVHNPEHTYPPTAVLFGKAYPTVFGCRVAGREGIKRSDAYDDLVFGSGDGVVLARAAQVPEGYEVVKGGIVSSERGHIGLLGDLEALGKCLNVVTAERARRVKLAHAYQDSRKTHITTDGDR